jgi:hypothetical protein
MQNFVILTIYENACDTWTGLSDTNIYDWCVNHFSIILSNHMFRFKSLLWSRSVLVSAIELLKYSQNKINIDWRLPRLLWNQAPLYHHNNTKHFLFNCPAYKDKRNELFKFISTSNQWFTAYDDDEKFVWILSNEERQTMKKIAQFIYDNMKVRDHKK